MLLIPLGSAAADGTYTILGAGTKSCGAWTDARRASGVEEYTYVAWIQGYITEANGFISGDLTAGTDVEGIKAWVDNYCAAHPLDDLASAASALVGELVTRLPAKHKSSK